MWSAVKFSLRLLSQIAPQRPVYLISIHQLLVYSVSVSLYVRQSFGFARANLTNMSSMWHPHTPHLLTCWRYNENGLQIRDSNLVFKNTYPNLADEVAPASKSFQDFINSVPSDSLSSFTHVTAEELKAITKGFKDGQVRFKRRTLHVPNLIRGEKKYHPYCLK